MALPFFESEGSPGSAAPSVRLQFGSGSGDAPFGGVLDAVADLLGGAPDAWRIHVAAVQLRRSLAPEVDTLQVQLARSPHGPAFALGDEGFLELGAGAAATKVFSGRIDTIHSGADAVALTAGNGSGLLARQRLNRSYENKSPSEIIEELASSVGITSRTSSDAGALPRYVVDDGRSLYEHAARLADLNGASLFFDGDGVMQLAGGDDGESVRTFTYGADIMQFSLADRSPNTASIAVVGEGAAGEAGSNGAFWLRKDPTAMRVATGSDAPLRHCSDARLRSNDAVSARARAIAMAQQRRSSRGTLVVAGAPEVGPGSIVTLEGLPDGDFNGEYFVARITHRFDAGRGFSSELHVYCRGDSSGFDLLGALGSLL